MPSTTMKMARPGKMVSRGLNPFLAALLHNLSSLAVVLNSARLARYRDGYASPSPACTAR